MTNKLYFLFPFLVILSSFNALCQKTELIKLDDLKIDSISISKDSVDKFLNDFGIEKLEFEEYIEEYPLSSGDKLNFYFDDNLKFIVVFFGDQKYLQNIVLFTKKHSLMINGEEVKVRDCFAKFKNLFPKSAEKYNPKNNQYFNKSAFLKIMIDERFDYYGNVRIDFKSGKISKIIMGFLE